MCKVQKQKISTIFWKQNAKGSKNEKECEITSQKIYCFILFFPKIQL